MTQFRLSSTSFWTATLLFGSCLLIPGCGAWVHINSTDSNSSSSETISVAISPAEYTLMPGQSQQLIATVTGTQDKRLSWSVNGIVGGSSVMGTVSAAGLYQAPVSISEVTSARIEAISTADARAIGRAVITIRNIVSVDPEAATVAVGDSLHFAARINGFDNPPVEWTVNGLAGGSTAVGVITPSGIYTAPSVVPEAIITVTVTDAADSQATANAMVTVFDPAIVESHDEWLAGVAEAAKSYGCADISVRQEPTESMSDAISRFGLSATQGGCLILWPVSTEIGSIKYSLAWGGKTGGKDILYISDISQMRIWNGAPVIGVAGSSSSDSTAKVDGQR